MAVNIVKKVYECFGKGDINGFLELCEENIEWVVNGPYLLEKCQSFTGHKGVRRFLKILEGTWSFNTFVPREFIVDNNKVVVLGEETGTNRLTGEEFQNRWAHVFTIRSNKIVSFREFLCNWCGDQHPPAMSWQESI